MPAFHAQFELSDWPHVVAAARNSGSAPGLEIAALKGTGKARENTKNSGNELSHLLQTKDLALLESARRTVFQCP